MSFEVVEEKWYENYHNYHLFENFITNITFDEFIIFLDSTNELGKTIGYLDLSIRSRIPFIIFCKKVEKHNFWKKQKNLHIYDCDYLDGYTIPQGQKVSYDESIPENLRII